MHLYSFIYLLAFIIGVQPIATDLYLPAMPDLALGLGDWVIAGVVLSSTSTLTFLTLFYGLGQVAGGYWVDRFGRRPSLLWGMAIYTLCAVGCIAAPSLAVLLMLRSIQGLATATIVVSVRAAMRDSYSVQEAPRVMSQVLTRVGVVVVFCPLVGAWLTTNGGWRAAMTAVAVYGAVLLAWCAWQFEETRPRDSHPLGVQPASPALGSLQLVQTLCANPGFRQWTLLSSLTMSGIFTFLTISSHLFIGLLAFSAYAYGAALVGGALTFVASNVLCSQLLKSKNTAQIAMLGAMLSLAGGMIQVVAAYVASTAPATALYVAGVLLAGQYLFVLGHGMLQSCAMAGSTADFAHMAGRASAWSGLITMVAAFAISQAAASFVDAQHSYGVWPCALTVLGCGAGLVLLAATMRHPR